MHEPQITVIGNLGADPRLRTTASGAVVTDFRVASTPRRRERGSEVWVDGETMWFRVTCWKQLAEHAATSLRKGSRVVVAGDLTVSTWTGDDGRPRQGLEVRARTVGYDLSRGRVVQERAAPLAVTSDPGDAASGEVDLDTGELRMVPEQDGGHDHDDEDDLLADELLDDRPVAEALPA